MRLTQLTDPSIERAARQAGCLRQRGDPPQVPLAVRHWPRTAGAPVRRGTAQTSSAQLHRGKVGHCVRIDRPIRVAPSRFPHLFSMFSGVALIVNFSAVPNERKRAADPSYGAGSPVSALEPILRYTPHGSCITFGHHAPTVSGHDLAQRRHRQIRTMLGQQPRGVQSALSVTPAVGHRQQRQPSSHRAQQDGASTCGGSS